MSRVVILIVMGASCAVWLASCGKNDAVRTPAEYRASLNEYLGVTHETRAAWAELIEASRRAEELRDTWDAPYFESGKHLEAPSLLLMEYAAGTPTDAERGKVRGMLGELEDAGAFAALDRAAEVHPLPGAWDGDGKITDELTSHLSPGRWLRWVVTPMLRIAHDDRDFDAIVLALRRGFVLARLGFDQRHLVGQLAGIANIELMLAELRRGVVEGHIDATMAGALLEVVDAAPMPAPTRSVIEFETVLSEAMNAELWPESASKRRRSKRAMLAINQEVLGIADDPPALHTHPPMDLAAVMEMDADSSVDEYAEVWRQGLHMYMQMRAIAQSSIDATRLMLAIEMYRSEHGRVPGALEELAPAYLPSVPDDALTGHSFVYAREDDARYTLYSIGKDMTDDGGVHDMGLAARSSASGEVPIGNDIVYTLPRRERPAVGDD